MPKNKIKWYIVAASILITILYLHIQISYIEVCGILVNDDNILAVGINSTDRKKVLLYSEDGKLMNSIPFSSMGDYKLSISNDELIVYPSRADSMWIFDFSGNFSGSRTLTEEEYKSMPKNAFNAEGNDGTSYYIDNTFGYCKVIMESDEGTSVIYSTKISEYVFRTIFVWVCCILSIMLCLYIIHLFEGKYDE